MADRGGGRNSGKCLTVGLWLLIWQIGLVQAEEARVFQIDLPAQPVAMALNSLSEQTGVSVLFSSDLTKNRQSKRVVGYYSVLEALQLLLKGTGLSGGLSKKEIVTISLAGTSTSSEDYDKGENMKNIELHENQHKKSLLTSAVTFFASVIVATNVIGQTMQPTGAVLEEIIVTAQKRTQNLQDVPISIETVSGEFIRDNNLQSLWNLSNWTPGLVLDEEGSEGQSVAIRGVGTVGKNLSVELAVPTFVDGIHFGRASSQKSAFLDIERVEILRGPQPIFFGQNATAGAISIISKRPGPEWQGFVEGEVSRFDSQLLEFGVGGPVTDTFGIRVAGKYEKSSGYMKDWFTGDPFPHSNTKIGRVILQWTPTERLNVTAKFDYADQEAGDSEGAYFLNKFSVNPDTRYPASVLVTGQEGANSAPLTEIGDIGRIGFRAGPLFVSSPEHITVANIRHQDDRGAYDVTRLRSANLDVGPGWMGLDAPEQFINGDLTSGITSKPWHTYLDVNYQLTDGVELRSLTGFSRVNYETVRGVAGHFGTNARLRSENLKQWSQDIQLTSTLGGTIEWMTGLYWQQNDVVVTSDHWEANSGFGIRGNYSPEDSRWLSAVAAVTFNFFNNNISIDLGGRYTDIHKVGKGWTFAADWIVEDPVTGQPVTMPAGIRMPAAFNHAYIVGRTPYRDRIGNNTAFAGVVDESDFNPQIVLRYRPTEDTSVYVKYAESFKAGGFDTASVNLPSNSEDFTFNAETANIWEAGLRASFLNGAATANLTLFRSRFKDLQVSSYDAGAFPPRSRTSNAASQKSDGIEFNGRIAASERLTLGVSAALMDATMLSYPGASCTPAEVDTGLCGTGGIPNRIDRTGQPALNAPEWQGTFNINYWMPFMDRFKSDLNVYLTGSDGYIFDRSWDQSVLYDTEFDATVSLAFSDMDDTWKVSFFGRNLMAPRPTYHPENDISDADGVGLATVRLNNFVTYGVRLGYNF
jgi:iron complex outermembrane receptor protein